MIRAIGIDPGPMPGIVRIDYVEQRPVRIGVFQCTHADAPLVLGALLREPWHGETYVQTERFVIGRGSGKAAKAGERTRDLIGRLQREVEAAQFDRGGVPLPITFLLCNASEAKRWADDDRLTAVGLLKLTEGMRHARDGARHCLYVATNAGRIPDPLSKKARRTDG
jgi:hypothetical protein